MKEITLKLKHTQTLLREAVAWFITGADVSHWIKEVYRWGIPQEHLRLLVLPRSIADRSAVGVLIILPPGAKPTRAPRALGFGVIAGKLYLPVDAELWPPVEPHELKLAHEFQVFHPGIGMVGFEPTEFLKLADLLRQPPSRVENWNFSKLGVHLNQHLRSVQLLMPLSMQDLFGDAQKEIGSEPIKELPPAPDEPWNNPAAELWTEVNRRLAQALHLFLRSLPHTALRRTWLNDLEDWAARKFQGLAQDLEKMRNKEIHRLLHQLENDPEQGLRHAIPMNQFGHRGKAPPVGRLGSHTPDFSLEHLRGGMAADLWHLSAEIQVKLRAKYYELANRELQLGRFRRAAYIYAELLGDLDAAASALKQGRHFREAALIYKDHLRRPREAAVCLAEGGLFAEAIAIYEEESLFLEAGDLHLRLGQDELARAAYELEVQRRLSAGDRLGSAQVLEEKLNEPEKAVTTLAEGWPHSPQAGKCLAAEFDLLARKSWHTRAATRLKELRSEKTRPDLIQTLSNILASQSSAYPDRLIRHSASDLVRVKASQRLETQATRAEVSALGDALIKLVPEDKLLARDVFRFSATHREQFTRDKPIAPVRKRLNPILVRTLELPKGISWHTVKSCGSCFFAAGNGTDKNSGRRKLFLIRGDWEGNFQTVRWPEPTVSAPPLLLEVDEETSRPAGIILTPSSLRPLVRLPEKVFPAVDRFPGVVPAGTPNWLSEDFVAICTRGAMAWLLRDAGDGLCECRSMDGTLVGSLELTGVFAHNSAAVLHSCILVQRDYLWVSTKRHLFLFRQGKAVGNWEAETDIVGIVPSAPNLPLCLLARLEKGVSLHWTDALKEQTETLCDDLAKPLSTFTADGTLVILAGREGRLCEVSHRGETEINTFTLLRGLPIAVVRADGPNQFAVFCDDGKAQVFRVSA